MKRLFVLAMLVLPGCASPLAGDSPSALDMRQDVTIGFFDAMAPDDCSFNAHLNLYQCDDPDAAKGVNERVPEVRVKVEQHFKDNPWLWASKELVGFFIDDLYGCYGLPDGSMYCKDKLPSSLIGYLKDGSAAMTMTEQRGMFRYKVAEQ